MNSTLFRLPRSARVVMTFNGSVFHVEAKKCYRRILAAILKYRRSQLVILIPDTAIHLPGMRAMAPQECGTLLNDTFKKELDGQSIGAIQHSGVAKIPSALIVRSAEAQAFFFDHNSIPVPLMGERLEFLMRRFADVR